MLNTVEIEHTPIRFFFDNNLIGGDFILKSAWSGKVLYRSWNHRKKTILEKFLDIEVSALSSKIRVNSGTYGAADEMARPYIQIYIRSYDYEHQK